MNSHLLACSMVLLLVSIRAFAAAPATAQTTPSATSPAATLRSKMAAKPEIDLSTPASALASYFRAEQAFSLEAINKTLEVTQLDKRPYVDVVLNFRLWRHYLERQAIRRFGKDDGIKVEGHARSLDDQLALDLDRLKTTAIEQTKAPDGTVVSAKLFLAIEKDRPDGLQTDRFDFLDTYYLIKTPAGWKLDFLRTCDSLAADREPQLHFEAGIFPIMAHAMKDLSESLAKGEFPSAGALNAALADRWNKAYAADPAATEPTSAPDMPAAQGP